MADSAVVEVGKPGAAPAEPPDVHKRSLFIKDSDSGLKPKEKGLGAGKREGEVVSKNVEFSGDVKRELSDFLDNYLTGLLNLREVTDPATGKSLYESILNNPNHLADRQLVELLTSEKTNERGTGYDKGVDEVKLKRFISSERGKIITTQLLERNIALRQMAIGLVAAASPEARRENIARPTVYRTGVNEGALRDYETWIREKIPGTPAQRTAFARISVGNALLGGVLMGPGGFIFGGAAPAAVYGAARGVEYLRREGMVFKMDQSVGAFKAISQNPVEKAFVREVFGIDTDDFTIVPPAPGAPAGTPPTIELKATGRTAESLMREQQFKVLQGLYRRRGFYTALGIPQDRLDALPEQFLYRVSTTNPLEFEKTGALWEDRIMKKFKQNEGGVKDAAGRRRRNPLFNTGPGGLDDKGNLLRFLDARNSVLGEYMQSFLELELLKGDNVNTTEELEKKITELRKPDGLKDRKAGFKKIEDSLTADKGLLEQDKTSLDSHKTNLTELQKAREDLNKAISKIFVHGSPTHATDVADALSILDTLNSTGHVLIGARNINSIADRWTSLEALKLAREQAIRTANPDVSDERVTALLNREFAGREHLIQTDATFVEQITSELRTLESALNEKKTALAETTETATKMKAVDSAKDFIEITGWGISDADLRTQTIQQILAQINAAGGWPVSKNEKTEFRTRAYRAMAEARARPLFPTSADFNLLTNPAGLNISEYKLRFMAEREIQALVGAGANRAQIRGAMRVANERLSARVTAFSQTIDFTQEKIIEQQDLASDVSAEKDLEILETTVKLRNKRARSPDFPGAISTKPAQYTDTALILPTDKGYTDQEETANQPKGYYEMLDLFFGYKDSLTRGKDFEVYARVIPPARLATIINESLGLGIAPGTLDIAAALTELGNKINNKDFDARHMQMFVGDEKGLVYKLTEQSRAI